MTALTERAGLHLGLHHMWCVYVSCRAPPWYQNGSICNLQRKGNLVLTHTYCTDFIMN